MRNLSTGGQASNAFAQTSSLNRLQREFYSLEGGSEQPNSYKAMSTGDVVLPRPYAYVTSGSRTLGYKVYELKDHLGNIRATLSDIRMSTITPTGIGDFHPDVLSMTDYYAFGMEMVGRVYNKGGYRYGFNGKENDNEVQGVGNSVDFGARMYDSRLGRWLSLDPLMAKYPSASPYNAFNDSPILFKDPDGRDPIITITDKFIGYAEQKIYRTEGMPKNSDYYIIKVPLYLAIVTDDQDKDFKMSFLVTRDAWVLNKEEGGDLLLDNIAFEPARGGSNEYVAEYIDVYPHKNNTSALELRQGGSKVLNSEPRKNDKGENTTTASSVMLHVSGIYSNEEENVIRHSSSLACFGIVNIGNSTTNTSDAEANRVMDGIWNQADKDSYFGHSDIKIIVQPRENVQRTKIITPSENAQRTKIITPSE